MSVRSLKRIVKQASGIVNINPVLKKICTLSLGTDNKIHITHHTGVSKELMIDVLRQAYESIIRAEKESESRIIIP